VQVAASDFQLLLSRKPVQLAILVVGKVVVAASRFSLAKGGCGWSIVEWHLTIDLSSHNYIRATRKGDETIEHKNPHYSSRTKSTDIQRHESSFLFEEEVISSFLVILD
jgi:hypothetical protein